MPAASNAASFKDARIIQAQQWVRRLPQYRDSFRSFQLLFADASFRRYFRLTNERDETFVVLDSPPDKEPLEAFISIAASWRKQGIDVPEVYAFDCQQGFAVLEDLGDTHLEKVSDQEFDRAYSQAVEQIVQIQHLAEAQLPVFDQNHIQLELSIMPDWTLPVLDRKLQPDEAQQLTDLFRWLEWQITSQPYTTMHRDYHCRNLMMTDNRLAIIDFQGAMQGPYCYDIVSLTTDVYRSLTEHTIETLQQRYLKLSDYADRAEERFRFDCACVRLQRHIKILGLFCRLYKRDGKPQYLRSLPRVCQHIDNAIHLLTVEPKLQTSLALLNSICQQVQNAVETD